MQAVICVVVAYLIGSVTFSFVVGKLLRGVDVRKHGSGNAGATNTLRVLGKGPAILVLLLDIAKGVLAVWIGKWIGGGHWIPVMAGLAVIAGHNWPIFFGFKGGKGIATTIGVIATLAFLPALYAGFIAILVIVWTRYVSLGSLLFTAFIPLFVWLSGYHYSIVLAGLIVFILAMVRHRTNIQKLLQGKENKLGSKA